MNQNLRPHLLLFTVNLLYAGNYTIAKFAMPQYITAEALVVIRAFFGMAAFYAVHAVWIREKVEAADWPRMILCGLTGVAVNQMMFFKGLSLTHPINASLIMITVPILVMIIAAFALRERVTLLKIFGVVCGLSGAAMIIVSGESWMELVVSRGDLYILINATSYAIYLVIVKSLMVKYESYTVVRWVFFFGFFMVLPFGFRDLGHVSWGQMPASAWWAAVYVLIGVTFLAYLFNALALKVANATLVSTYIYLQPLLATLIAIGFGRDILTGQKVIAGALIFLGVYMVSRRSRRAAAPSEGVGNVR